MIDRSRMTERVSPSLLRLEARRSLKPLLLILVGFLATLAAAYYIVSNINEGIGSTHQMKFELADVTGVVPGRAEARFYGIAAGKITNTQLIGGHAVLTATIANKFGNVYKNASVELRPNTAFDDMYVDIVNRGTKSAGVAGPNYIIPENQTTSPVNLADVLNTFQPDVRTQLYNLLDQFGNGLADRGYDLKQAFTLAAPFIKVAQNVANQLAVRAQLTKELVHNASALSAVLASRSTQLHQFVTSGTQTLEALSTEGGAPLRETLNDVSGSLDTVDGTWLALHRLLPNATAALANLRPVADELGNGLASIKRFSVSARPAVTRLQKPVQQLTPFADALEPVADDLSTSADRIKPQVSDFDAAAKGSAKCIGFIDEFFNWDYSFDKYYDQDGPFVQGNAEVGFYTLPGGNDSNYVEIPQCDGGYIPRGVNTPKYNGPAPAP